MDKVLQTAINAAAECGIAVEVVLATKENGFHRASARFANDTTSKSCTCLMLDPAKAVAGAIDALTGKTPETIVQ